MMNTICVSASNVSLGYLLWLMYSTCKVLVIIVLAIIIITFQFPSRFNNHYISIPFLSPTLP